MALTPQQQLVYQRELNLREARESFWMFCCLLAPEFYKGDRWHLKLICEVLQALYERRLTGKHFRYLCDTIAPQWYTLSVDWNRLEPDKVYTRIMENIPPRSGKSRTLIMFCEWILGKNVKNRIITCSYNDDLASDFSRYTRDGIMVEKNLPTQIVYSEIFPKSRIQRGNSSFMQWALEGQFFNYKGAGVQGSITGKGGNVTIIDDPIKDAETAYNEGALAKIWQWYTGTFLSRLEDEGEGGIEIVNMTRWSKHDICGKILSGPEKHEWIILSMEACSPDGEMLCPGILSKKKYESLKLVSDSIIFAANYHQKPIDLQGRLYQQILTYNELPCDENGNLVTERVISYTDTADTGDDYLCNIVGHVYKGEGYVTDVYFSKDGMETTEPATAKILVENDVGQATIESNNGGRGFARNVERIMWDEYRTKKVNIKWFHQSKNKVSRILSNATFVMNHIYFPVNWKDRWTEFYEHIVNYQREGKNKHDDGADALTGFSELIDGSDFSPRVYEIAESNIYNDSNGPNYELWYHRYFAIGYGTTTPFVILEIIEQDGLIYIENEYYYDAHKWNKQKDDNEYVADVKEFINNQRYSSIITPDVQSFRLVARKSGLRLRNTNDDLLDGIRLTAVLLKLNKIKINNKCTNLLNEFPKYAWDNSDTKKPVDAYNYGLNALRYFCKTIVRRM